MKRAALIAAALAAGACAPAGLAPAGVAPTAAPAATPAPGASPWPAGVPSSGPSVYTIASPPPLPVAYAEAFARPTLPFLRAWAGRRSAGELIEGDGVARTAAEWRVLQARFSGITGVDTEPDYAAQMRLLITRIWPNDRSRLEIIGVEEQPERLVVRSVIADDQAMFVSPAVSFPFDVVDVPSNAKSVVFEAPIRVHWVYLPAGRIR